MKRLLLFTILMPVLIQAQFDTTFVDWHTPKGGAKSSSYQSGYNAFSGGSSAHRGEVWYTLDMNGDGKLDLVVTAELDTNLKSMQFNSTQNPYWKVYLNTGSEFSSTAINWSTPVGGYTLNGTRHGYYILQSYGLSTVGSERWDLVDLNGDDKPDLVVVAETDTLLRNVQFNASVNPYWKVYLNTGSGFSNSAINWNTPVGGIVYNSHRQGYNQISTLPQASQSQQWAVVDMNGDGKKDLVVTSDGTVQFSPNVASYWKVYLNTGNGFASSFTQWSTPVGGYRDGLYKGYLAVSSFGVGEQGSQQWNVVDLNGDNKPDLIVFAQTDSASDIVQFNYNSSPYWKVYLNTGSSFNLNEVIWSTPIGGLRTSSGQGYVFTYGNATSSPQGATERWQVTDFNDDGRPDLIVTSQFGNPGSATQFNDSLGWYWKVYLNYGEGFSQSFFRWTTPVYSYLFSGVNYGFQTFEGANDQKQGMEQWNLADINGDNKPDFIITARSPANNASVQFDATTTPYWKVYLNTTQIATQVEEMSEINYTFFPNPSNGSFTIRFPESGDFKIQLIDALGQQVLFYSATNEAQVSFDVRSVQSGIYLLRIQQGKLMSTLRLVFN